jgi:hypothetical protein
VPYQGAQVGDKYIDLTIANATTDHLYIPVKDLVDVYTEGNGIDVSSGNVISVVVDPNNANGLSVGASGVALATATTSSAGAMSAADKTKLEGIASGAEVNVQSDWNQTDNTSDDFIKNKPSIPTATSDLTNDSGFITSADIADKADKVSNATNGNFAGLDANGNLTDSGHKHGDYVTALGTSENYVTWTKNGTANNLTVPYSTSASRLNITALSTGADMNDYTAEGVYGTTTTSVCASFVNAPEGRSNGEMRLEVIGCVNNGAYLFQRYWARGGSTWQLYIRTKSGTGWSSWVKNLDSSNGVSKVTSTDNAVVRFDGTGGSIQNSGVTINDSNHITAAKFITSGGTSSQFVKGDGSLDSNTYATTASLESYLPLAGGTMTGSIRRDYDSVSDVPVLNILSNNQDVWLWRVKDKATGAATATSSVYGFGLKYLGTGSGNNNSLALYSDNQGGIQVKAVEMKQDGTIEFSKAITAPTAAAGTNTTQLATTAFVQSAVNNNSYCANLQTTATSTYNTIPEVQKIKINGDSTLTAASTENCEMVYDKTNKCLKFVFN